MKYAVFAADMFTFVTGALLVTMALAVSAAIYAKRRYNLDDLKGRALKNISIRDWPWVLGCFLLGAALIASSLT